MDLIKLREDFEGLPPEDQMQFMASVGPTFCRRVMADRALRRRMMVHCLGGKCRLAAFVRGRLLAARATALALAAGLRAGVERWRQATTAERPAGGSA